MNLPEYLMVSETDGHLYDTRVPGWHKLPPIRRDYQRSFDRIKTVAQLKASLRVPYAWPGGYEIALLLTDGELLCNDCAKREFRSLVWDIKNKCNTGWRPDGAVCMVDIDGSSPCCHCNRELSPYVDEATETENP